MSSVDLDSTLIRFAKNAVTFSDIADFAGTLERRPIRKLLGELPALAKISLPKFMLATRVIRRRFEEESTADQFQLQSFGLEIAGDVMDAETAAKIRGVFSPSLDEITWRGRSPLP